MKRASKSVAKLDILDSSDPISTEYEAILSRIRQRAFELSHIRPHDAHQRYDWIMAQEETIAVPPVELIENDWTVDVRFGVAGVNPDDVSVMVTPDQVLLKSESSQTRESDTAKVHLNELSSKMLFRSVGLPHKIDVNTVKVTCSDGIVLLTASKARPQLTSGEADEQRPKRMAGRKAPSKKSSAKMP